jgi:hypothetical protein
MLSLMRTFGVIVLKEFVQRTLQRAFTEQDQLAQALVFQGSHPTLLRTHSDLDSEAEFQGLNAGCGQCVPERCAELRVSVVENVTTLLQNSGAFIVALRPICSIQSSVGCFVMPARVTRRRSR